MCVYADVSGGPPASVDGRSSPLHEDYYITDMQAKKYPPQDKQKHCTCIHRKCRKIECDLVKECAERRWDHRENGSDLPNKSRLFFFFYQILPSAALYNIADTARKTG